jgi:hypothetical protein
MLPAAMMPVHVYWNWIDPLETAVEVFAGDPSDVALR